MFDSLIAAGHPVIYEQVPCGAIRTRSGRMHRDWPPTLLSSALLVRGLLLDDASSRLLCSAPYCLLDDGPACSFGRRLLRCSLHPLRGDGLLRYLLECFEGLWCSKLQPKDVARLTSGALWPGLGCEARWPVCCGFVLATTYCGQEKGPIARASMGF